MAPQKVWSPRAVAAARGQEARAAGGKRRGPTAGAVVGRGSNFSDFGPPPRVKNESFTLASHDPPKFWIQSSPESPEHGRMRSRRLPTIRATPIAVRGPICMQKKEIIWSRWHPIPVKNVNYPRAPSSRRSGLVGPHTTPAIVNYKYMTSTL